MEILSLIGSTTIEKDKDLGSVHRCTRELRCKRVLITSSFTQYLVSAYWVSDPRHVLAYQERKDCFCLKEPTVLREKQTRNRYAFLFYLLRKYLLPNTKVIKNRCRNLYNLTKHISWSTTVSCKRGKILRPLSLWQKSYLFTQWTATDLLKLTGDNFLNATYSLNCLLFSPREN